MDRKITPNHRLTVAVAVPVYKTVLNEEEKASFRQLIKILKKHDIFLFTHIDLNLDCYKTLSIDKEFQIKYFDKRYFESIDGYNRLLCGPAFYKAFLSYKYILIYQLDAWVFRDELLKWCELDYDYIGAPWFHQPPQGNVLTQFIGVGNGGFSLRKVNSHLRALKSFYYLTPLQQLARGLYDPKFGRYSLITTLKTFFFYNITYHYIRNSENLINEDIFWNLVVRRNFKWFKAPDPTTALKFSFEMSARELYEVNSQELPFGCHGWTIYNTSFWSRFIDINFQLSK